MGVRACGAQAPVPLHPFRDNQRASRTSQLEERNALSFASRNHAINGTRRKPRSSSLHPKEDLWGRAGGWAVAALPGTS